MVKTLITILMACLILGGCESEPPAVKAPSNRNFTLGGSTPQQLEYLNFDGKLYSVSGEGVFFSHLDSVTTFGVFDQSSTFLKRLNRVDTAGGGQSYIFDELLNVTGAVDSIEYQVLDVK